MIKRKHILIGLGILLFLFGPAILIAPTIDYRTIENEYAWGTIKFNNSALGKYGSQDILQQPSVRIYPYALKGERCQSKGQLFEVTSKGKKLSWDKSIDDDIKITDPIFPKVPVTILFVSYEKEEKTIPVTLSVEFTLSEGCQFPGSYKYSNTMKPRKQYYWLGYIVFQAILSV